MRSGGNLRLGSCVLACTHIHRYGRRLRPCQWVGRDRPSPACGIGTIDALEQLCRYLEYIRAEPGMEACRGILVGESVKPQARTLARSRGIETATVDLAALRGLREPDLRLFVT